MSNAKNHSSFWQSVSELAAMRDRSAEPLHSEPKSQAKLDELREWATAMLATLSLSPEGVSPYIDGYCKALTDMLVRL